MSTATALYAYNTGHSDELAFEAGDVITLDPTHAADPGWSYGRTADRRSGMFPSNYVELLAGPAPAAQAPPAKKVTMSAAADGSGGGSKNWGKLKGAVKAKSSFRWAGFTHRGKKLKAQKSRVATRVWLMRNWFLLLLVALALLGLILALVLWLYNPCVPHLTETEVITKKNITVTSWKNSTVRVQQPADVMVLLDGSGSMGQEEFDKEKQASKFMIEAFRDAINDDTKFRVGTVQWAVDAKVEAQLSTNVAAALTSVEANVPPGMDYMSGIDGGGTNYKPAMDACESQIQSFGYESTAAYRTEAAAAAAAGRDPLKSYKLCIVITDGGNNDEAEADAKRTDLVAKGYAIKGIISLGNIDSDWSRQSGLKSTYSITSCANYDAESLDIPDIAQNIAGRELCKYFSATSDMNALKAKAATIANSLVSERKEQVLVESTKTTTVKEIQNVTTITEQCVCDAATGENQCPGDETYLLFLLFAVPLLAYLLYKPMEHVAKKKYLARNPSLAREVEMAEVTDSVPVAVQSAPAPVEVESAAAAEMQSAPMQPVQEPKKKYKWELQSSCNYNRGGGAAPMRVNWGQFAPPPPSAPKVDDQTFVDLTRKKSVAVKPRGMSVFAPANVAAAAMPTHEASQRAEAVAVAVSDNATVQTLAVVFDGGDWQEDVARWACPCCAEKVDRDQRRASQISCEDDNARLSSSEWAAATDPGSGATYYYNSKTNETSWEKPADFAVQNPMARNRLAKVSEGREKSNSTTSEVSLQ